MPPPIRVELVPHDPRWADDARREGDRFAAAIGGELVIAVHHIGSTSIPAILAKPVIDLVPVLRAIDALDALRERIERAGYAWWGEYGLPGRRFCTLTDPATGARRVHVHAYQHGSPEIDRHLAFRDHLRAHPALAREYEALKIACRARHPDDTHAYSECKGAWIRRIESEAIAARARIP